MQQEKSIELIKVASNDNVADIFTKPLPNETFRRHASKLVEPV